MILAESVLVESKTARDHQLERLSHERATEVLSKVKSLYFALWQGTGAATTEQVRQFYEVDIDAVEAALRRCRAELQSDGVKALKGKLLKDFKHVSASKAETSKAPSLTIWTPRAALRLGKLLKDFKHVSAFEAETSKAPSLTIWTPRAALRLGMVLQDSPIAKAVRTSLLDAIEVIPAAVEKMRELELQLALAQAQAETAKAQERLMAASQVLGTINPDLPILILRPDVTVIERPVPVETTVMVDEHQRPIARYEGVGISALAHRYGFGKGNRANNACREWLRSIGIKESDWVEEPTAHLTRKLSRSMLQWLDLQFATKNGVRQRLLGE